MSCIVLDIKLTRLTVFEDLGAFISGKIQGYSFRPPKKYKTYKASSSCTRNMHGDVWNSGLSDYSELRNILPNDVRGEYFAERTEKCNILGILLGKEIEILDDHCCLKVQLLVKEQIWICFRYPVRHNLTLRCAERKAELFGNWILIHLK